MTSDDYGNGKNRNERFTVTVEYDPDELEPEGIVDYFREMIHHMDSVEIPPYATSVESGFSANARSEYDKNGDWEALFNDGDMFRHDNRWVLFAHSAVMYDMRNTLMGDAPVAVTIGPTGKIDRPEANRDD